MINVKLIMRYHELFLLSNYFDIIVHCPTKKVKQLLVQAYRLYVFQVKLFLMTFFFFDIF